MDKAVSRICLLLLGIYVTMVNARIAGASITDAAKQQTTIDWDQVSGYELSREEIEASASIAITYANRTGEKPLHTHSMFAQFACSYM